MREGIREKMVPSFYMNDGDTWEEVSQKKHPSEVTVHSSWVVTKSTQGACSQYELQSFLQQGNPYNNANS